MEFTKENYEELGKSLFYNAPYAQEIEHIETHISHVFLTGTFAYKIKKQVKYEFLDFSTLEKRKIYYQKELEYNRLFSPEIYVGLKGIFKCLEDFVGQNGEKYKKDQLLLEGVHFSHSKVELVEYVIVMRQFQSQSIFSRLLKEQKLSLTFLNDLSIKLAQTHKKSSVVHNQNFGSYSSLLAVWDENFTTFHQIMNDKDYPEDLLNEINRIGRDNLKRNESFVSKRMARGFIKRCHGDLHLNNICIFRNEIQFFDCIEFNELFRCIDLQYDLCLLLCDFVLHDREDMAFYVLNHYLEHSDDYEGLRLFSFFLPLRLLIRIKVLMLQKKISDPRVYLEKCLHWVNSSQKKGNIILVGGLSGSGKTTYSRHYAFNHQYIHLRSDVFRKRLIQLELDQKAPAEYYDSKWTVMTYGNLIQQATSLALSGLDVLIDAKWDQESLRGKAIKTFQNLGISIQLHYCQAKASQMEERLKLRKNDASDATYDLLDNQINSEQFPCSEKEGIKVQLIDTEKNNYILPERPYN